MPKKKKTPQQKKRESYAKDRRNTYGESGARSRFAIAQRKRNRSRAERAAARDFAAVAARDPELAQRLEGKAAAKRRSWWAKWPDDPLGEVVHQKLKRRVRAGGMPKEVAASKAPRTRR